MALTPRSLRHDVFVGNKRLKCGPGSKPCGNTCIPKDHTCRASWNKPVAVAAGTAAVLGAGLVGTALFHPRERMRNAARGMVDPVAQAGFGLGNIATGNFAGAARNAANIGVGARNFGTNARTVAEGYGTDIGNAFNRAKTAVFKWRHHRPAGRKDALPPGLTPLSVRVDLKCGRGAISQGEKCHKGSASKVQKKTAQKNRNRVLGALAIGAGAAALGLGAYALTRRGRGSSGFSPSGGSSGPKPTPSSPSTGPVGRGVPTTATSERQTESKNRAQRLAEAAERQRKTAVQTSASNKTSTVSVESGAEQAFAKRAYKYWGAEKVLYDPQTNFFLGRNSKSGDTVGLMQTQTGHFVQTEVRSQFGNNKLVIFDFGVAGKNIDPPTPEEGRNILRSMHATLKEGVKDMPADHELVAFVRGSKVANFYKHFGFINEGQEADGSYALSTSARALKKLLKESDDTFNLPRGDSLWYIYRTDAQARRCGKGYVAAGKKCRKNGAFPTRKAIAIGLGAAGAAALTAGGIYLATRGRRPGAPSGPATRPSPYGIRDRKALTGAPAPRVLPGDRTTRRLTGYTPYGLLPPRPPKSKTQRLRENTQAAVRGAERAIGRAAQAEITRLGAVGNAMASAGEATGMATKTTLRELRLRAEAMRRRYEPGYRRPDQPPSRPQSRLPEGGSNVRFPFTPPTSRAPSTENVPIDPRTGQPRRRRPRGFG